MKGESLGTEENKKGRLINYLNNVLELQVIFCRVMSRKKACFHLTGSRGLGAGVTQPIWQGAKNRTKSWKFFGVYNLKGSGSAAGSYLGVRTAKLYFQY